MKVFLKNITMLLCLLLFVQASAVIALAAVSVPEMTVNNEADFLAMQPDGTYYIGSDFTITQAYEKDFTGLLYGNGHTLTVSCPMFELFDGYIADLNVSGKITTEGKSCAAVAVRSINGMLAENVITDVDITVNGSCVGMCAAGILACDNVSLADADDSSQPLTNAKSVSTFINCKNTGNITVNAKPGIADSAATASQMKPCAGGIGANLSSVYCINCENTGNISIPLIDLEISGDAITDRNVTSSIAGGIVANAGIYTTETPSEFYSCKNSGDITAYGYAGGIAGHTGSSYLYAGALLSEIKNIRAYKFYGCENSGKITGPNRAAGIVAYAFGSPLENADIQFCLNTGDIYYGDTDGQNFGSYFVAYTNSTLTRIIANISMGKLYEIGGGYSAYSHAFIGFSSYDPLEYECLYNAVYDPDRHLRLFSVCTQSQMVKYGQYCHQLIEGVDKHAIRFPQQYSSFTNGDLANRINSDYLEIYKSMLSGKTKWSAVNTGKNTAKFNGSYSYEYEWQQPYGQNTLPSPEKSGSVTQSIAVPGDLNGDGRVDVFDLVRMKKYLSGQEVEVCADNLDVNNDGTVDVIDLIRLKKSIAG